MHLTSCTPVAARRRSFRRAALAAALVLAGTSSLVAQTTIGYSPVANYNAPTVAIFTGTSLNSSTAFIVPFQINTLGNYSLTSVSLLLAGNASLSDFSLSVSSTLPTDLTAPTALTAFSAAGTLTGTETAYNFTSGATPTLAANTTYYFRIAYTGGATANWIKPTDGGASGSGGIPALTFFDSVLISGSGSGGTTATAITYRSLTSGGFSDGYNVMGAFSITASAASAIPEPATYAAIFGGLALVGAVVLRRRRSL